MQHDADFSVRLPHECPRFVHGSQLAAAVDEINIAHGDGQIAMQLNHLIADSALLPGLDGKALVVGITGITANKIGQRASLGAPEGLRMLSERGLEGHGSVLIAIGLIEDPAGRCLGRRKTPCGISLGDRQQAVAPALLGIQHLLFGNVAVHAHR